MAFDFILALAAGTASVIVALLIIGRASRLAGRVDQDVRRQAEPLAFLFRGENLVDATIPARYMLEMLPGDGDWQRLMALLATRMPGEGEQAMRHLQEQPVVAIRSPSGAGGAPMRAIFEDLGEGLLRITLSDPRSEDSGVMVDSLTLAAMEEEIDLLRSTMDGSPMLAWREDADGAITWANAAYLHMVGQIAERPEEVATIWPLPRLIDLPMVEAQTAKPQRVSLDDAGQQRWFECHHHGSGDQTVAVALPADAAVKAERSLREFVQTLTKTFADLPIGMAIFDRERHLQLFNPALIDLTGLPASFLTARPTLFAFLDRLREARMVPEPKNYRSWRNQMNTLEKSAASGHHVETWSLPGGQTYRVSGRPHPDGAVAFLFDDITSEIAVTRRFRSELSMGKEVLDALEDAVVVFAGNGQMMVSNRAYGGLWGEVDSTSLGDHISVWQDGAGGGPGLAALIEALSQPVFGTKTRATGALAGPAGQLLSWSMTALTSGRMMVRFAAPPTLPKPQAHPAQRNEGGPDRATQGNTVLAPVAGVSGT